MEQLTGSKLWKQYIKTVYCQPVYLNSMQSTWVQNYGLEEPQAGIKIAGRNINNLRYADYTTRMEESEEELKSLFISVKEESEKLAWNSTFNKGRSGHLVPSLHGK